MKTQINYRYDKVWEYLPEFIEQLKSQLVEDDARLGNTWKERPIEGQTERTQQKFNDYFDLYNSSMVPVNWLKVAGNAIICWIREYELKPKVELNNQTIGEILNTVDEKLKENLLTDLTTAINFLSLLDDKKLRQYMSNTIYQIIRLLYNMNIAPVDVYKIVGLVSECKIKILRKIENFAGGEEEIISYCVKKYVEDMETK